MKKVDKKARRTAWGATASVPHETVELLTYNSIHMELNEKKTTSINLASLGRKMVFSRCHFQDWYFSGLPFFSEITDLFVRGNYSSTVCCPRTPNCILTCWWYIFIKKLALWIIRPNPFVTWVRNRLPTISENILSWEFSTKCNFDGEFPQGSEGGLTRGGKAGKCFGSRSRKSPTRCRREEDLTHEGCSSWTSPSASLISCSCSSRGCSVTAGFGYFPCTST